MNGAHDRRANAGASYLLARIEAHRGLVILTTNLRLGPDWSRRIDPVLALDEDDGRLA